MHQSQSQRLGHKTKTLLVAVGFSCISVAHLRQHRPVQHTNWQKLVQMLPISRKWKGLTTPQKANPVRLILSDSAWGRYRYHLKSHSFRLSATLLIR